MARFHRFLGTQKRRSRQFSFRSDGDSRRKRLELVALWGVPIGLTLLSGVLIASTQRGTDTVKWYYHWATGIIGLEAALLIARSKLIEWIKDWLDLLYFLTIASLLAVRFVGISALGAQRWINIAGLHVQPSEFAKVAVILFLADVLANNPSTTFRGFGLSLATIAMPWFLVFIQPDLGTSLVFGFILLTMLFWSGMRLSLVILLISPLVSGILGVVFPLGLAGWIPITSLLIRRPLILVRSPLSLIRIGPAVVGFMQVVSAIIAPYLWVYGLKEYQRDRLILFLDPGKDPLGGGYHLLQSQITIGAGEIFGRGLMQGEMTKLQFIPEQHTDFIFSVLGEETGFLGCVLIVSSFVLLIWRLIQIAGNAKNSFESLVVIGIAAMVMFQVFVNISMTIGLGPITGIPLPWMSYGRSAIIANFLSLGLCASIARRGGQRSIGL